MTFWLWLCMLKSKMPGNISEQCSSLSPAWVWSDECLPLLILFELVCFDIMTSFVFLIPSNNYSLLSRSQICCISVHVCVCACMCVPAHMSECTVHQWLHPILKPESEQQKRLMYCPSHFVRNFIVNGAQKCTCLQAIWGFGISLCVLAPLHYLWSVHSLLALVTSKGAQPSLIIRACLGSLQALWVFRFLNLFFIFQPWWKIVEQIFHFCFAFDCCHLTLDLV